MKIVYVLISNEKDTYYEQTVISVMSLRKVMPEAEVILLVDNDTFDTFKGKRTMPENLNVNVIPVNVPAEYNSKDRSRYLKTTMRSNVTGDFLYIDGDTVICESMEDIDRNMVIGCVLDKHYMLENNPSGRGIIKRANQCGFHSDYEGKHFNGGFMWVKDDKRSYEFFNLWYDLWKLARDKGVTQDQASLNEANYRFNGLIQEMDGTWNCQISNRTGALQYLYNARMIHYFASYGNRGVPYDLADREILKSVFDDEPDHRLLEILDNPKAGFKSVCTIGNDLKDADLLESNTFLYIKKLYLKHKRIFKLIEKGCHCLNVLDRKLKK